MKINKLIFIVILFLLILLSYGIIKYFQFVNDKKLESNLIKQIEDWNYYQEITDQIEKTSYFTLPDCSANQEFKDFNLKAVQGEVKVFKLNGALPLVLTPNYFNWGNEKFLSFSSDPTAVCYAGGIYPLKAYQDKLLWRESCSTGALPAENTLAYKDFLKCQEAEQVLNEYFK